MKTSKVNKMLYNISRFLIPNLTVMSNKYARVLRNDESIKYTYETVYKDVKSTFVIKSTQQKIERITTNSIVSKHQTS